MRFQLLVAFCVVVIATILLSVPHGLLSINFAHSDAAKSFQLNLSGGSISVVKSAIRSSNAFTVLERWSTSLVDDTDHSSDPPQFSQSAFFPRRITTRAGTVAFAIPLGWIALAAFLLATSIYLFRWRVSSRRLLRGLCRSCGYDLRNLRDVCPECGTSVATPLPLRWPLSIVPRSQDVLRITALAGVMFFTFIAILSSGIGWLEHLDRAAAERHRLEAIDYPRFVYETTPQLSGNVLTFHALGVNTFAMAGVRPIESGDLVLLDSGTFVLKNEEIADDVAIVGMSPEKSTLKIHLNHAQRVRLENVTIDCADDPFLDFRDGGSVSCKNCLIDNYNSGAGGSNSVFGVNATLLMEGCTFEGDSGRQSGRSKGNAFDLRGQNRAYLRHCNFINNAEISRENCLTFEDCQSTRLRWGSGAVYALRSPALATGVLPTFNLALDELSVVHAVDVNGRTNDAATDRAVNVLSCSSDNRYWLALLRSGNSEISSIARRHLVTMKIITSPAEPMTSQSLAAVLQKLDSTDELQHRAAVRALASGSAEVFDAAMKLATKEQQPGLLDIQRARALSIPFSTEIDYAELAGQVASGGGRR